MNVIFVEPSFPYNQREFVRGLHAAGANVIGIGERPASYLSDEVKGWLVDYVQVSSVVHEPSLLKAVKAIQNKMWVDRLETTVEAPIMAAAAPVLARSTASLRINLWTGSRSSIP